ncbi:MAG TPA: redoxin domain-containing protein [Candidatus Acidoferrales bacterium]|nr:redoxin domain-containing protein [Candidatus Acidoferrales bacterium]
MNSFGRKRYLRSAKWPLALVCAAAMVAFAYASSAQDAGQPASQPAAANPSSAAGGQATGRGRGRGRGIQPDLEHPVLPIGSPAPDFSLEGIDGKIHTLGEYSNAKVLAVVFESNHCPVSIAYEERIRAIYQDYKDKGVQLIAINPNNAGAVRLNELGYTDSTDSMPEMKIRAALRHIDWPYLYDGETQTTAAKFGAVATPHIFIFDQDRKLRYEGRIDDSTDITKVKTQDARNAIDALLAGQPVPVASTPAFGCSTKWLSKATGVKEEMEAIMKEPVNLSAASADDLKKIRANASDKTVVVEFWSLKCKDCLDEFHDYENTYRMYRRRKFDMITVSTDSPGEQSKVLDFLHEQYASGTNLQFDSADTKALQAAVGEKWKSSEPFVMVIGPNGNVVFQKAGKVNILEVRRHVLASIPNDGPWFGVQEYWTSVIKAEGNRN